MFLGVPIILAYANVIGNPKNIVMIYTGNVTIVNINALLKLLIPKHYYIKVYCL